MGADLFEAAKSAGGVAGRSAAQQIRFTSGAQVDREGIMTGAFWDDLSGDARDPEFVRAYADDAIRINRIDSLVNAQHDADGTANVPAILSEMSSTTAARVLGISRPALIKLVSDGLLPSHKVGAHHRFTHADVAKLAEVRRAERSGAFDKLRELDEALEKPGDGDDTKHS